MLWRFYNAISADTLDVEHQVRSKNSLEFTHMVLAGGAGAVVVAVCVTTLTTVVVLQYILAC
jgi:uncharacterized membrane protein YidH (DUF202 family)